MSDPITRLNAALKAATASSVRIREVPSLLDARLDALVVQLMGEEPPTGSDSDPGEAGRSRSRAAFVRMMVPKAAAVVGAFVIGYLIDAAWARLVRGFRLERQHYRTFVLGKYRVHHNVVGYVAVLVGLFLYPILLIPLGLGMIVGHGTRDGSLWFIEGVE